MTTKDGQVVRLSTDNWIKIGGWIVTQTLGLLIFAALLWTKVAVLETKMEERDRAINTAIATIENRLEIIQKNQ